MSLWLYAYKIHIKYKLCSIPHGIDSLDDFHMDDSSGWLCCHSFDRMLIILRSRRRVRQGSIHVMPLLRRTTSTPPDAVSSKPHVESTHQILRRSTSPKSTRPQGSLGDLHFSVSTPPFRVASVADGLGTRMAASDQLSEPAEESDANEA